MTIWASNAGSTGANGAPAAGVLGFETGEAEAHTWELPVVAGWPASESAPESATPAWQKLTFVFSPPNCVGTMWFATGSRAGASQSKAGAAGFNYTSRIVIDNISVELDVPEMPAGLVAGGSMLLLAGWGCWRRARARSAK